MASTGGMSAAQRRRPESIYRLNDELAALSSRLGLNENDHIQPTLYDPVSRGFYWLAVKDDVWPATDSALFDTIWEVLREDIPHADVQKEERFWPEIYARHRKSVEALKPFRRKERPTEAPSLLEHVLACYSGFPTVGYVDGILRDWLERPRALQLPNRLAMLSARLDRHEPDRLSDLTELRGWVHPNPTAISMDSTVEAFLPAHMEARVQQDDLAPPTLLRLSGVVFRLSEGEKKRGTVIVVPIYNRPFNERSRRANRADRSAAFGGMLLGNIHVLTERTEVREVGRAILAHAEPLARAFRAGTIAEIVAAEPEGAETDAALALVRHFVRQIIRLHDWEHITVFEDEHPFECWDRIPDKDGRMVMQRCRPSECSRHEKTYAQLRASRDWLVGEDPETLVDANLLEHLSPEERATLRRFQFAFNFPSYCLLPPANTDEWDEVERHYWHDRMEVWNIVIPRVRAYREAERAREARDKLATVAIVGRNMSHNIGSHILSKLSSPDVLLEELAQRKPPYPTKVSLADLGRAAKHLARFNGYLRDRMDLVATLATTEASWGLPMRWDELVHGLQGQTVVRKWLSDGSAEIVESQSATASPVVVPHGVVGMQAFYLVVENVIRNSFRHGTGKLGDRGRVRIGVFDVDVDTVAVEIVDEGSTDGAVPTIRREIERRFYDDDDNLDRRAWGLKEMRLGAGFLRRRPSHLANTSTDRSGTPGYPSTSGKPWIEVTASKGHLAYRLLLLRPKRAFVLADCPSAEVVTGSGNGIEVRDPFGQTLETLAAAVSSYPMLVCLGEQANALAARLLARPRERFKLPVRVLSDGPMTGVEGPIGLLDASEVETFMRHLKNRAVADAEHVLWTKWCGFIADGRRSQLCVCDRTAPHDGVTFFGETHLQEVDADTHRDDIFYARHAEELNLVTSAKCHALIGYAHKSDLGLVVSSLIKAPDNRLLRLQLLEAGLVGIAIFDERLSAWATADTRTKQLVRAMGIRIKQFERDDDVARHELSGEAVSNLIGSAPTGLWFVSVHKNLVDKIAGPEKNSSEVDRWARDVRGRFSGRVIICVHSGRGRIGTEFNLPFVEYSNVERYVRDTPSKFHLTQLFMALRES